MQPYLQTFREIESDLSDRFASQHDLAFWVGSWKGAAVLKLQKPNWTQGGFGEGIFFSIWMEPKDEERGQVLYNVHALKHRLMEGYAIRSNEFADCFREGLGSYDVEWPNLSVKYGPQTLIQGWVPLDRETFREDVESLIHGFVKIHGLIDTMLEERRA